MAHPFICPNCGHRTTELDRNIGFTRQRKGCEKCGFAFLFELLDDYYPAPDAAFFVCDGEGRVVGCGKNSFAFTGVEEEGVIGQRVEQVLGLTFANGDDPVETVLEWGVRALDVPVRVSGERDVEASAKADMFPAYDADGGLLLVRPPAKEAFEAMANRPRNALVLLIVAGLAIASLAVIVSKPTRLGLDLKGGVQLIYQGRPTSEAKVTPESLNRSIDIMRK